jgi:hypothetical protein
MASLHAALFAALFLLMSQVDGVLYGYLDPGTGSVAIQLVLGAIVALLATTKLYWARVVSWLRRKPTPEGR